MRGVGAQCDGMALLTRSKGRADPPAWLAQLGSGPPAAESPPVEGSLLASADASVVDAVLSASASAGVTCAHVSDVDALVDGWGSASLVLVGDDLAAEVVARDLPQRPGVHLVARSDEACRWSAPLAAAVVVLPDVGGWLPGVFASGRPQSGHVVAVAAGHGGAGASTVAAGVALAAAARGVRVALVDADPIGGGLDLLLGAERVAGWRWPNLLGAQGQLADLAAELPVVDGVALLSMPRRGPCEVARPAAAAVLHGLSAHHELVVVDVGRAQGPVATEASRLATSMTVVCRPQVRAAAAVAAQAARWDAPTLVVRAGRAAEIPPGLLAQHVGLALLGTVPEDARLPRLAQQGRPPGGLAAPGFARACSRLAGRLMHRVAS